ncbi:hypothetical protein RJT34_32927 [Clitoria ternatea]
MFSVTGGHIWWSRKACVLYVILGLSSITICGKIMLKNRSRFSAKYDYLRASFEIMASTKVQRVMTQPINLIFRFLQSKARIQIWLFEQKDLRIEGRIIGFDEYMNLVLDDAEEVNVKKKSRKTLGRILLKGDNITLMMNTTILEFSTCPLIFLGCALIARSYVLTSDCTLMEALIWHLLLFPIPLDFHYHLLSFVLRPLP